MPMLRPHCTPQPEMTAEKAMAADAAPDRAAIFERSFRAEALTVRDVLAELRPALPCSGTGPEACGTVELVLAEVLNNIAEHAGKGQKAGPRVVLRIVPSPDGLEISVTDNGRPLPGEAVPEGRLPASDGALRDLPEGGFGWYLIRSLAAEIRYSRTGCDNHLRFVLTDTARA